MRLLLSLSLVSLGLVACGSTNEALRDAGTSADAARVDQDGDTGNDGDETPDASGSQSEPRDGGPQAMQDAAALRDGSVADAGATDSGMSQVSNDAGMRSRRAEICGDATSFPSPLPTNTSMRRAEPVGSASFGFIEGPVWIAAQGVLLFSDMSFGGGDAMGPPARIRRLKPPMTFDELNPSSNTNGLALAPDGTLLGASHDNQALSRFDLQSGARTPIDVRVDGKRFNSPNDLTVRSDGIVYFTDPDWQLGARTSETKITGVYRTAAPLDLNGPNQAKLVDGTLEKPNGIALSPDEQTLYVGSQGSEIWKYPVMSDGSIGARSKFADTGSSDGMAVDCAGNLYVTSGTVEVFAPNGTKLGEITLDGEPSNAAFGGSDRKTLYITAGAKLHAIKLSVPGFPY